MFFKRLKILLLTGALALGGLLPIHLARAVVSGTYTPVQVEADGVETDFDFDFKVFATSELLVQLVDQTTLEGTTQTLGEDYTATLNSTGGTISFDEAPAEGYDVYIARQMAVTQTADIPSGGLFREVQIENALDRTILIVQQQDEKINRALLQNPYEESSSIIFPTPEASKLIAWNADADALENVTNEAVAVEEAQAAAEAAQVAAEEAQAAAEEAQGLAEAAASDAEAAAASIPEAASQAQAEAGTDNATYMTPLRTAQSLAALGALKVKVIQTTRAADGVTADVAYTGVGFTPKAVIVLGAVDGDNYASIGISTGTSTNNASIYDDSDTSGAGTYRTDDRLCFILRASGGAIQTAAIKTFDSDGFTLTWTKTGTPPSVTIALKILCIGQE